MESVRVLLCLRRPRPDYGGGLALSILVYVRRKRALTVLVTLFYIFKVASVQLSKILIFEILCSSEGSC